jgi:release factor glutamine methyltransferase
MATTAERFPAAADTVPLPRLPFCLPGVYRPQDDTHLLASVLAAEPVVEDGRVLDVCAGTGAAAITAALAGWGHVTAIDVSRRAVLSTRLNARHLALSIRAHRVSFAELRVAEPFDLVLANPPYVPCAGTGAPVGRDRSWDAGPDGRALLDPLCSITPRLLAPSGRLLLVQSDVSGVDATLDRLKAVGLRARVVARRRTPFGPIMRARAEYLESAGLIEPGQRHEDLVVIRADRG